MKSVWLALAAPWLALGCLSADQVSRPMDSMLLLADDEAMKQEVLRYLSPGMAIKEAKGVMEHNDFRCVHRNCAPGERPYLSCKAVVSQTSAWQALLSGTAVVNMVEVRLFYEGGGITDIQVRHYCDAQ